MNDLDRVKKQQSLRSVTEMVPALLDRAKKQADALMDVAAMAPGLAYYLATGKTPQRAYLGMCWLTCMTDGRFNDAVHGILRRLHPPLALDRHHGCAGRHAGCAPRSRAARAGRGGLPRVRGTPRGVRRGGDRGLRVADARYAARRKRDPGAGAVRRQRKALADLGLFARRSLDLRASLQARRRSIGPGPGPGVLAFERRPRYARDVVEHAGVGRGQQAPPLSCSTRT